VARETLATVRNVDCEAKGSVSYAEYNEDDFISLDRRDQNFHVLYSVIHTEVASNVNAYRFRNCVSSDNDRVSSKNDGLKRRQCDTQHRVFELRKESNADD
jgi:hypothetical protein